MRAFAIRIRDEFEDVGLGKVCLKKEILDDAGPERAGIYDVGHHMGGTKMGADASESIVTPNLQVRGLDNVWICSASVFPTSSHSNPTLTVLALADRLACQLLTS